MKMKEVYLSHLDTTFIKTKSGINNLSGSITPRTATKKAILDTVKIEQNVKPYQEQKDIKFSEALEKLKLDLEQNLIRYKLLTQLKDLEDAEEQKITENKLKKVTENISIIEARQKSMTKSQSVSDNCDIMGFGFETIYQKGIAENDSDELYENTPAVLRYGLNTGRLTDLKGSYIEKGLLHPYEIELFGLAINYLGKTESAEAYVQNMSLDKLYANNAVLVDIFDRSTGFVNADDNQTHTVVLWKKTDGEIVLIDPSNVNFSNHLNSQISQIFKITVSLPTVKGDVIYGTQGKFTGYSGYDIQDPLPRDCIDIAVKIAFEINEQQKENTDIGQIEENVFSQISNKSKLNDAVKKINGTFIRELQSSNKDIRIDAKQSLGNQDTQLIASRVKNEMRNLVNIKAVSDAYKLLKDITNGVVQRLT